MHKFECFDIDTPEGPQTIWKSTSPNTTHTSVSSTTGDARSPLIPLTVKTNKSYLHKNKTFVITRFDYKQMNDIDSEIQSVVQRMNKLKKEKQEMEISTSSKGLDS